MPLISVPLSGNLLQTTKSVAELLAIIAFPAGSSADPDKVRALDAYHMALDWLVNTTNWNYYRRRAASGTFTAGTATYDVPERIRAVASIRITSGNPRPIYPLDEDLYNKIVYDQSGNATARYYSLADKDQHSQLRFYPTPDSSESFQVDYYRDPTKATDRAATPDIATWMEAAVISKAQGYVALWKGRPDHVNFFRLADRELQLALGRDGDYADDDQGFVDQRVHGVRRWPWDHPNYSEDYL